MLDHYRRHVEAVHAYLDALGRGDTEAIIDAFADDGEVISPFLGRLPARPFFARLAESSMRSDIEIFDILVSAQGAPRCVAYFHYHWTLRDGTVVQFDCCDVFDFAPPAAASDAAERPRIKLMTIIYDTAPLREGVGDKYAVTTDLSTADH